MLLTNSGSKINLSYAEQLRRSLTSLIRNHAKPLQYSFAIVLKGEYCYGGKVVFPGLFPRKQGTD